MSASALSPEREPSVRERVRAVQIAMRDGGLTPMLARQSLVEMTGLLGNINDEKRRTMHNYKLVLLECLNTEKRANRARIVAETTPAYVRLSEVIDAAEEVNQMIVTCRAYLRSLDEEIRLMR